MWIGSSGSIGSGGGGGGGVGCGIGGGSVSTDGGGAGVGSIGTWGSWATVAGKYWLVAQTPKKRQEPKTRQAAKSTDRHNRQGHKKPKGSISRSVGQLTIVYRSKRLP